MVCMDTGSSDPEKVPVPDVNSGVNVGDPGPNVCPYPIEKCICWDSLYIEMKLCNLSHFFRELIFVLAIIRLMEQNK